MHSGQLSVWESGALDIVACAGTQGGKTKTEPSWLLREIQRCAPFIKVMRYGKFIFAGPTLTLLDAQAIPSVKELFEEDLALGKMSAGNKPAFRFSKDGLMRTLGFCNCPVTIRFCYTRDSSNIESMTAAAGIWDEAGQKENKEGSYGAYNRRLKAARSTRFDGKSTDPAKPALYDGVDWLVKNGLSWWVERYLDVEGPEATFGRRLWGTTPYEWGWFKNKVVDRAERREDGFELLNWPSWMNPFVSEQECRKELDLGMALWQWEMMYLGLFTRPAGIIYDTFDFDRDTCEPFHIPSNWSLYPGVDFGSNNMAAVIIAEDPESRQLYQIDEYRSGGRTFAEHADAIRKNRALLPGAGGSHQEDGWREAFRGKTLALDEPPVNDIYVQIACVYAEVKTHKLTLFRSCTATISQMQSYSREIGSDGEPTEEIKNKASYHYLDALRYIVTKLRPPQSIPGAPVAGKERFAGNKAPVPSTFWTPKNGGLRM